MLGFSSLCLWIGSIRTVKPGFHPYACNVCNAKLENVLFFLQVLYWTLHCLRCLRCVRFYASNFLCIVLHAWGWKPGFTHDYTWQLHQASFLICNWQDVSPKNDIDYIHFFNSSHSSAVLFNNCLKYVVNVLWLMTDKSYLSSYHPEWLHCAYY